jgi:hypothetical protein
LIFIGSNIFNNNVLSIFADIRTRRFGNSLVKPILVKMVKMNNKLVIKENFDEADLSDDVDDEVFVRDGKKNMVKIDKQKCDEQPLMPTRKKLRQRQNSASPEVRSRQPCNIYNCLLPVYFAIAAVISIACML